MTEQYYMLLATDGEDVHEARMAARPDHLARLGHLQSEGQTHYPTTPTVFPAA